jgi:uncharacterized FlaG/YvyC family protein
MGILSANVFATASFDKELEATILKTKELFDIKDTYDTFDSRVNSNGNKVHFYLNWSDSRNELDSISITTDSKGNIISYNKYGTEYKEPESKLPNYTRNEALKFAKEFIGKIDKEIYNGIELIESNNQLNSYDVEYNFTFDRVVNGIPYRDNTVSINVNKFTGEINNFYTNWDRDIIFPSANDIITLEDGRKAFIDKIGLDLMYKNSYKPIRKGSLNNGNKYYLVYSLLKDNKVIDALTGEAIDIGNYGQIYAEEKAVDSAAANGGGITPEEREEIDKLSGIIGIEEIEKKAINILGLDKSYTLQNRNLHSSYKNPGEYQWDLYFSKKVENGNGSSANISLNAKTSELLSYYKYIDFDSNAKANITKAEAMEIAKAFVKKQQPTKIEQLELITENLKEGQLSYSFRFIRKADDIYVESDSISVTVNAVNKDISSYNLDWYKGELPPKGQVIDLDKAYDILFNDIGYELRYANIYDYEKSEDENKKVKLVYGINSQKQVDIDAHTGDLLDYSGELYKDKKVPSYKDIDDSYAKDMINSLAEYGVGFNTDEFKPKNKIKQKDFMYLLFKSMNSWRDISEEDIDKVYDEFLKSKVIKAEEKNPEKIVTKEEAVKYIVRAMNFGKIADLPGIFDDIFKDSEDISPGLKGYVNIAYGLGIISGDGTEFINPKVELTREDAANIIYKYMFN